MKRNSFVDLAEKSRIVLMASVGMDELDYNLSILEGGCNYLDQLVKPTKDSGEELARLYKEHLVSLGYWDFYQFLFRHLEIAIAERWTRDGSIESRQPTEWKRKQFLQEVQGLPWNREANHQLDAWLKDLGPNRQLPIPNTEVHEHAH